MIGHPRNNSKLGHKLTLSREQASNEAKLEGVNILRYLYDRYIPVSANVSNTAVIYKRKTDEIVMRWKDGLYKDTKGGFLEDRYYKEDGDGW